MEIIARELNVIGLRAEFPRGLTKNVYAYVDSRDQQSLCLLAKKKLRGFRALKAYSLKGDTRYCLIECELNRREEPAFLAVMEELRRSLLIKGYRDYEEFCGEVFASLPEPG